MTTVEELKDFLLNRMRMSHIYQPAVIRTLLEHGGEASIRTIAQEFLSHDETQIAYYEHIAQRYPKSTLHKHQIIDISREGYFKLTLNVRSLTDEQLYELIQLCNAKIHEYKERYSGVIGDVRTDARFVTAQGGTKHESDIAENQSFGSASSCIPCSLCDPQEKVVSSSSSSHWILAPEPICQYHSVISPKRHVTTLAGLSPQELDDLFAMIHTAKHQLQTLDETITSIESSIVEGSQSQKSGEHAHIHVVPRRLDSIVPERQALEL